MNLPVKWKKTSSCRLINYPSIEQIEWLQSFVWLDLYQDERRQSSTDPKILYFTSTVLSDASNSTVCKEWPFLSLPKNTSKEKTNITMNFAYPTFKLVKHYPVLFVLNLNVSQQNQLPPFVFCKLNIYQKHVHFTDVTESDTKFEKVRVSLIMINTVYILS